MRKAVYCSAHCNTGEARLYVDNLPNNETFERVYNKLILDMDHIEKIQYHSKNLLLEASYA